MHSRRVCGSVPANTVFPGYMLVAMTWVKCSIHERKNYCDDDLAGLLGPLRQPSITDASRGGRDSLLVEAICWLDDVTPSFNQPAGTQLAVRIAHPDLTKGSSRTLLWFPNS